MRWNPKTLALVLSVALVSTAARTQEPTKEIRSGLAVDAHGNAVIDPTKNVLDLVEASIRRQDDLRNALDKQLQTEVATQARISELRYTHAQDLALAQAKQLESEARIRAEYADRLAVAEAKRIDAIRAVDVNAVAVANQRTSEQATALQTQTTASAEVLRNQVARSAEDLRALVATTAATALQNQQQQFSGLSARITTLEQAGAEGKGKTAYQDPVFLDLLKEVRTLSQQRVGVAATEVGRGEVIAWSLAALMLLISIGTMVNSFLAKRPRSASR